MCIVPISHAHCCRLSGRLGSDGDILIFYYLEVKKIIVNYFFAIVWFRIPILLQFSHIFLVLRDQVPKREYTCYCSNSVNNWVPRKKGHIATFWFAGRVRLPLPVIPPQQFILFLYKYCFSSQNFSSWKLTLFNPFFFLS
jgi:hypothetical protein